MNGHGQGDEQRTEGLRPATALAVCNGLMLACLVAAVACLWQWGEAVGWTRIDRFSGGALLFYVLFVRQHVRFYRAILPSRLDLEEAFGASYDPLMGLLNGLLLVGQLTVFMDYGHWHLTPWLERGSLQYAGLGAYGLGLVLVVWADRHLLRELTADRSARRVVTTGPYSFLRHPRYAGLFLTTVALALTLASFLGWMFAAAWFFVVRRRIRIEEEHLRSLFGPDYARYAGRTGMLFPLP